MTGIAGLVLAAGTSSRMGTPKQLLPIGRSTLLDHVLAAALQSNLERVILVLGFMAQAIMKGLKSNLDHPKLEVVQNQDYAQGISTSLIAGLSAVEKDADGVMVILGDMPRVSSGLIDFLLQSYEQSRFSLAALTSGGKRSHPVIIGRHFFSSLLELRGDEGAKALFLEHADQVLLVEPFEEYDDRDIDTREDYMALTRDLKGRNLLDPKGALL
ncbi:MAG: nucleotidyltransferase family protein [Desulfatiglandales bacterium]